ncbi:stimulated by retinoic acid gene 6 protein-like [Microcaecilia unicolor]|uniref:Stimulated by retinoic acid gene 6 protein-like n=1 Tax=Microcaecilia unicolor TaxID=1415580 RepID=A0A6P7XCQ8_9AMPH|nr:stimulated by retinoic acid gene 6 protein-like [Microcaecilia unicolor]
MSLESQQTNASCTHTVDMELILHCSLAPAVFIIVVLSFLEHRLNRKQIDNKLYHLIGHFGIVVPLDFIGTFSNRWSFGFAIGAIANKVMLLFLESYMPIPVPPWAKAFMFLIGGIEVGLSFYPIFACLSTNFRLVGSILGFLYTSVWVIVTTMYIAECPHGDNFGLQNFGDYEEVIFHWPSLFCLFFLLGRFVHIFIMAMRARMGLQAELEENLLLQPHQAEHVKRLLRKPELRKQTYFQRKIYQWDPCFRFPCRMIGTSVLTLFCLYIFVVFEFRVAKLVLQLLVTVKNEFQDVGLLSFEDAVKEFISYLKGVFFFTLFVAILTSVTYIFHILACYRKHIKRLWKGDKSFLPVKCRNPSPSKSVAAIARYCGWQIAYIIWGYFTVHIVMIFLGLIFVYCFINPILHNKGLEMLKSLGIFILTVVIAMSLTMLQVIVASKFFLQPKISPEDKNKPLALNNRKAFYNFSYFFFFYNVFVGLNACLLRLLCSFSLGTWLIARIDRSILQKGYEAFDSGYNTWIGMLFMDHYHSNPVLVSFCHILLSLRGFHLLQRPSQFHIFTNSTTVAKVTNKARTRWLLLYTLLNNPSLITLRKPKEFNFSMHSRLFQASVLTSDVQINRRDL